MHNPERREGETLKSYRERQAACRREVRAITGHGLNGGTSSRQQFRDSMRKSGTMGKRIRASDALMAAWAAKRITKAKLRDEHGAFTLTGRRDTFAHADHEDGRRKWLAGISAQRGY